MREVLSVERLSFEYPSLPLGLSILTGTSSKTVPVFRDLSFSLEEGERTCLMGSNGSGKTTLLKVLLGLLHPTRGTLRLRGKEVNRKRLAKEVGFVHPDERSFYWRLSVARNLEFFGGLWGLSPEETAERTARVAETLALERWLPVLFSDLSTGTRQRVAIARAMLHDPPLLMMDEPTRSLDPPYASAFRDCLTGPAFSGKTMLIATHNPPEARRLADRCLILSGGGLEWDGPVPDDPRLFAAMGERP